MNQGPEAELIPWEWTEKTEKRHKPFPLGQFEMLETKKLWCFVCPRVQVRQLPPLSPHDLGTHWKRTLLPSFA